MNCRLFVRIFVHPLPQFLVLLNKILFFFLLSGENFIKSTEQGRQKHKQSTHELKQEMQKILKHPSLPLLAKKLDGLYRSLDQQTRNLEL